MNARAYTHAQTHLFDHKCRAERSVVSRVSFKVSTNGCLMYSVREFEEGNCVIFVQVEKVPSSASVKRLLLRQSPSQFLFQIFNYI